MILVIWLLFSLKTYCISFQISTVVPAKLDIAFISGTNMKDSLVDQRLHSLTGMIVPPPLRKKEKNLTFLVAQSQLIQPYSVDHIYDQDLISID